MKSDFFGLVGKAGSSLLSLASPYMGYIALVGVGAFGIVMYLYADEKEEHRETSSALATMTVDHDLLKQQYATLLASQAATEAQVAALKEEKANVQDKFEEAALVASERYKDLRAEQARLVAVKAQRERLRAQLEATKKDLLDAKTTYKYIPEPPPVSLAPPKQPDPVVSDEEIADAICNTTTFSDPVVEYIHDRVRSIYENGVSLSN